MAYVNAMATGVAWGLPARSSSERLVLLCLARHMDESGVCYPSQPIIAQETGLNLKTVCAALKALCASSVVLCEKRPKFNGNAYRFCLTNIGTTENGMTENGMTDIGNAVSPKTDSPVIPNLGSELIQGTNTRKEQVLVETPAPEPVADTKPRIPNCPVKRIFEAFNEECGRVLPQARDLTPTRSKAISSAWRRLYDTYGCNNADEGLELFRSYFQEILKRPFLCGQNDRGWKATLDFILRPSTITGMREGKYDQRRQASAYPY